MDFLRGNWLFFLLQLALEYGIKFMETSAKANINVENVSWRYYCLCHIIIELGCFILFCNTCVIAFLKRHF